MNTEQQLKTLRNLIELLNGHLTATQVIVGSLIATHPDPEALRQDAERELEETIAACLNSQHASEAMLEGMQSAAKMLLGALPQSTHPTAPDGGAPNLGG